MELEKPDVTSLYRDYSYYVGEDSHPKNWFDLSSDERIKWKQFYDATYAKYGSCISRNFVKLLLNQESQNETQK